MNDTELEDRLAAMLERRAAAITTVPPIRFGQSGEVRTRPSLAPFAVAAAVAAVLIAVGGTVVGIRSIHHNATPPVGKQHTTVAPGPIRLLLLPRPAPASSACRRAGSGRSRPDSIPLDHPINNVISVNAGTGEYLVEQVRPATRRRLRPGDAGGVPRQDRTGRGAVAGQREHLPLADGSAAVTADWIGYGLHQRGRNNGYDTAMLYNRHTRQSIVLEDRPSAGGQLNSAPILFGGKAYWLEAFYGGQHPSLVRSYDLATGTRTSTPVPAAVDLVYYGTGLAVVTQNDQGSSALANFTGTPLAPAAIRAAGNPGYASYDGTTLRWWNYLDNPFLPVLYANRPGSSQVSRLPINGDNMTGLTTWPFVEADHLAAVIDLRRADAALGCPCRRG